jgi:hypothetical protein
MNITPLPCLIDRISKVRYGIEKVSLIIFAGTVVFLHSSPRFERSSDIMSHKIADFQELEPHEN